MSSDNLALLSYTSNLAAGISAETDAVLLGQYISMSIIPKSDQDLTIQMSFSPDGINFDYTVSNTVSAGSNTQISQPVVGKWLKLIITNLGGVPTTFLRVHVYCTPSNSSIAAQISKIGNFDPYVNVANYPLSTFGDLQVAQVEPKLSYIFTVGTTGQLKSPVGWAIPYRGFRTRGVGTENMDFGAQGLLKIDNTASNTNGLIQGPTYSYRAGVGLRVRMTCIFKQGVKAAPPNDGATTEILGIGNSNTVTGVINNFFGFGYADPTLVYSSSNSFGIVVYNAGVRTFIPRNLWNVDKANGTFILNNLDWEKLNVFQIDVQYLGGGNIKFYIEDVNTGLFQLVHMLKYAGTLSATSLSDPSMGLLMHLTYEAGSIPLGLTDYVGCGSFMLGVDAPNLQAPDRVSSKASVSGLSAEAHVLSIRCDNTWYGVQSNNPIDVDFGSFACDGAKICTFNVYLNPTMGGVAAWTSPYSTWVPVSQDTSATFTALGTGILLFTFTLGKTESLVFDFDSQHLHINPGDILVVTAASALATDVEVCLGYHRY